MKRPWLAVLLNVFPLVLGLGYIYLGQWRRFGFTLLAQVFGPVTLSLLELAPYSLLFLLLLWLYVLVDVYRQARRHNRMLTSPALAEVGGM